MDKTAEELINSRQMSMKRFQGRMVTPGEVTAEAVVTTQGFNTLAPLQMLGDEFIAFVKDGMKITVKADGVVEIG